MYTFTSKSYLMNNPQPLLYLAYLIRLRRSSESAPWRVIIESPHTGERRGFATLGQFVEFLEERTGESLRGSHSPDQNNNKT